MQKLAILLALSVFALSNSVIHAQLVNDGATTTINGTVSTIIGDLTVGTNGSGTVLQIINGGRVTNNVDQPNGINNSDGRIGYSGSATGNRVEVSGPGSVWRSSRDIMVGYSGSANSLVVSNGGKVHDNDGWVGLGDNTSGNVALVTGAGSIWTNANYLTIGGSGSSNFLIVTNGGRVDADEMTIGAGGIGGDRNEVIVTGSGSTIILNKNTGGEGTLTVGSSGSSNRLTISAGARMDNYLASIGGTQGDSNNMVVVTGIGSTWNSGFAVFVGSSGYGSRLVVTNGGLVTTPRLSLGTTAQSSNNIVTMAGGSLVASGTTDVVRGTVVLDAGLLNTMRLQLTNGLNSKITFNGGTLQARDIINSNGLVFRIGKAALPATLELLPDGSSWFPNGLVLSANALLKGSGTVFGNITNSSGGSFSPGPSIGLITVNGRLMLSLGSTNFFEVNKSFRTNDHIRGLSNVVFGGTLVVSNLSGNLTNGDSFKLFAATNYSGQFNALAGPSPGAGLRWNLNRLPIDGVIRVVPSPSLPPLLGNLGLTNSTNFTVSASGVPYDPVYLITSANVAAPLSIWVSVATNYFDAAGLASFSYSPPPSDPRRFFKLRVD